MSMDGYTYEVWVPDAGTGSPDLVQWGTYSVGDLAYRGGDLARVAAELATTHLTALPDDGELRVWAELTGLRSDAAPGHQAALGSLRAS